MKILLTSAGFSNQSIVDVFFKMLGKDFADTSIAFVPTASHVEVGDKGWVINDLVKLKTLGFKSIDIVDISALPREKWEPRLREADVFFFEGGNTFHLMEWIKKSGLEEILPELLKTRVWVGVSAGSMVTGPDLLLRTSQIVYGEDLDRSEGMQALGLVDFYILPHLNSHYFEKVRKEHINEAVKVTDKTLYALDDESAIAIVDGKREVVSEGVWHVWNEK